MQFLEAIDYTLFFISEETWSDVQMKQKILNILIKKMQNEKRSDRSRVCQNKGIENSSFLYVPTEFNVIEPRFFIRLNHSFVFLLTSL
jgi:hypothetical protein